MRRAAAGVALLVVLTAGAAFIPTVPDRAGQAGSSTSTAPAPRPPSLEEVPPCHVR